MASTGQDAFRPTAHGCAKPDMNPLASEASSPAARRKRASRLAALILVPLVVLGVAIVGQKAGHPEATVAAAPAAADGFLDISFKTLEFDPGPDWIDAHVTATAGVKLPAEILALDGKRVRLEGFLLPTRNEGGRIREFFIMASQSSCCFGLAPRLFDFIAAKMPAGTDATFMGSPVVFEGVLQVRKTPAEDDWTPIFTMDCTAVYR